MAAEISNSKIRTSEKLQGPKLQGLAGRRRDLGFRVWSFAEVCVLEVGVLRRTVVQAIASLLLVGALVGCKTHSASQYVSPQVTGRVLDAESRQPLAEVKVQR